MSLTKCKDCGASMSKKAKACPRCGATAKKKTSVITWLVACGLIIWIFSPAGEKDKPIKVNPKVAALENVELDVSWKKLGSVMIADFTIENKNAFLIKNFTIKCSHFSVNDTPVDSNKRKVFDTILAGETKKFNKFNMGIIHTQAVKTDCRIVSLSL